MLTINKAMLLSAKTKNGGYTQKQVNLARTVTGNKKKAIMSLIGKVVEESLWEKFVKLNKSSTHIKNGKKKRIREKTRIRLANSNDSEFYVAPTWRELRVRVLEKYECKCMMCGRSPKNHGVTIHVDHIKPRSTHPKLQLCFENLQILCEDCNLGKSNRYETDYRPEK